MDISILQNGNLKLSVTPDEDLDDEDLGQAIFTLFEPYSTNGSYALFDASNANPYVGLTGAPCIAQSLSYDDEGSASVEGRLWYFNNYALESFTSTLKTCGEVIFQLAGEA